MKSFFKLEYSNTVTQLGVIVMHNQETKPQILTAYKQPTNPAPSFNPIIPLTTEQLTISIDPQAELQQIQENITNKNWNLQYQAIESIRRLIVHHRTMIVPHIIDFIPYIRSSCENIRSALSKNALLAFVEIFNLLSNQVIFPKDCLLKIIKALIRRAISDKKFLGETADMALEALINNLSTYTTIECLIEFSNDKNGKASCKASQLIYICLENMMHHNLIKLKEEENNYLIEALFCFRNNKDCDARRWSLFSLQILQKMLGKEKIKECAQAKLEDRQVIELLNDLLLPTDSNQMHHEIKPVNGLRELIRKDRKEHFHSMNKKAKEDAIIEVKLTLPKANGFPYANEIRKEKVMEY